MFVRLYSTRTNIQTPLNLPSKKEYQSHNPYGKILALAKKMKPHSHEFSSFGLLSMPCNMGAINPYTKNQDTLILTRFYFCFLTCQNPNSKPDLHKIFKFYIKPRFSVKSFCMTLFGRDPFGAGALAAFIL